MSFESIVKEKILNLCEKVYIAPEINEKKLNNAIKSMCPNVDPEYVIAIADTSIFNNAKDGLVFTGERMYIYAGIGSSKLEVSFKEIKEVDYETKTVINKKGNSETIEYLKVYYKGGSMINLSNELYGINMSKLNDLLNEIVIMGDNNVEFKNKSQTSPLSMMDREVKKNYVKLLCNFAFSDDQLIDAKEYAEIMSLIVRIELEPKDRLELRGYMTSHEFAQSDKVLIDELSSLLEQNQVVEIQKSLIKDMIFIYRTNDDINKWTNSKYIVNLVANFEVPHDQVDLIESAILNDEDILTKRKNDSEIKKSMKDIASKAAAVGVPLATIYLSGSVVGVSAAGITSGLASLGMGGVLGLSSMFTGIGVAVLIGVGTYKGLKKITGVGDLENNKQRELMLQAIIRNTQKSLNYLIEDVNEITRRLMIEIESGLQTEKKIHELTKILGMLSEGAKVTTDRLNYAERERLITHLPLTLDLNRLNSLTNTPTRGKYRDFVLNCYEQKEILGDDNTTKLSMDIIENLTEEQLTNLGNIFEEIGYNNIANASTAAIKGFGKNISEKVLG